MQSNSGEKVEDKRSVKVIKNGSYLVVGPIPLFPMTIACDGKGTPIKWAIGDKFTTPQSYLLCRCGQSGKKPFCDSSHVKVKFDGTEANQNEPFEKMAQEIDGPEVKLYDAVPLCASARFCHRGGDIWDVIHRTDMPEAKKNVVENSSDCPSGRLVAYDKKTGVRIEPVLDKSIGTIEDPAIGTSGPLWVRGGIPVYSADGKLYEVRNRVTLCRCGKSQNKPFCDSSHYPEEDREEQR
ncbi:MAG: CDGSH iron-sulfur domain-containing protein [Candidatus Bathyarchaeia archaeon]